MTYDLAFIGAGNMAEAIARGILTSGSIAPARLIAADISDARRALFEEQLKIRAVSDNLAGAADAGAIILAVKPQQMAEALRGIGRVMSEATLVISIAAGISTKFIEMNLGNAQSWRVVRTMPNTPMLVGLGAVALAPGQHASSADVAAASRFFAPAARVTEVTEDKIDAVTALSGSGPAYVFYLIEQMIAAGLELGLTPEQSELLAKQTVYGSAAMAVQSADTPQELRRKVTSPGGTTQAAIEFMETAAVGKNMRQAIGAACARSIELGKQSR
ncbi:MAG: pyrroline-5-carboxylate reductase [Burkholderiales bacterium]|nr:pyrroline-5-carboxylate reductase [Phycisphaerae bacterium]